MPARKREARINDAGPWAAWRSHSRAARMVEFITRYCVVPKGVGAGELMVLHPFQRDLIEEMFADGITSAVTSFPRGNGKSTLAASVATAALFVDTEYGTPQVPVVATTVGQAIRSVYGVASRMVATSPELVSRSLIFTGIATPRVVVPYSSGEMFPIAADPPGLQGLDFSLAIGDEVGFMGMDTWQSLLLATGKRPRSLVWAMGTPGLDRTNALYLIRAQIQEFGVPPGTIYHEFSAPQGCELDDREAWRIANPAIEAGFLQESALEQAMRLSPEAHFRVFRLGQHDIEGIESWLGNDGRAIWQSLQEPYELVPGAPSWVGVDVGIKRDSTAVVIVQKRPDERLHARLKLWLPTKDEPVDVTDVMGHLRELSRLYRVGAISFDPRFFDVPAKLLYDEGLPMVEVPQSVERMTPIVGALYKRIKEGSLTHDADSAFETQVLNAIPRVQERGFTLSKGKSRGRIDAAVALALAVDRADHPTKLRSKVVVV